MSGSSNYSFLTIDDTAAGSPSNELLGINDQGVMVGYYGSGPLDPQRGYFVNSLYPAPLFTAPSLPGNGAGEQSQITGINNLGAAVGLVINPAGLVASQTVNQTGYTAASQPSGAAGDNTYLLAINDLGAAVGYYFDPTARQDVAWELVGGRATTLSIRGASSAQATGINDAGVIVGNATVGGVSEGFIDDAANNAVLFLGGPPGAVRTQALGINNQGQVVGDYVDASGNTHGFVYSFVNPTQPGSYSYDINDPNAGVFQSHTTTVITGINDQGQIVGYYVDASGNTHGMQGTASGLERVTDPIGNTVLTVGRGSSGLLAGGSNAVTVFDPGVGGVALFANAGADTLVAHAGADTLVGGPGNDVFFAGTAADVIFLGAGSSTVVTAGASTVVAASSIASTVYGGAGTVVFGGSGVTSSLKFVAESAVGGAELVGGAGSVIGYAGSASGTILFAGTGADTLAGGSGFTSIIGGSGSDQLFDGAGGAAIFAGTGSSTIGSSAANTSIVAGAGNSFIVLGNGGGQAVFLNGAGSSFVDVTASSGNTSLVALIATNSSGANTFSLLNSAAPALLFAGSGATGVTFGKGGGNFVAGTGPDIFTDVKGVVGSDTIYGFNPAIDHLSLNGFAPTEAKTDLATAKTANGSTKLTLSDNTTVLFFGVTHLTTSSIG